MLSLHNFLLDVDGLDEAWEQGVRGIYYDPQHASSATRPVIMNRLESIMETSGSVNDNAPEEQEPTLERGGVRHVKDLSFRCFRKKLIEHFDILWTDGKVIWPSRTGEVEWVHQ